MSELDSETTDDATGSEGAFTLVNHFLIAMPNMADPRFSGSVIYICEHSDDGATGLVINRPTDLRLETLFERIDLKLEIAPLASRAVCYGGPMQSDHGFVLHDAQSGPYSSTLRVQDGLALTTSRDVLEAVAGGAGPENLLVTLGYASWGSGQLESELRQNAWLTVKAQPRIVFETPHSERFKAAMELLGIQPGMLLGQAGHA